MYELWFFCDAFGAWLFGIDGLELGGNPFIGEAITLRQGLSHACNQGFRRMECKIDCAQLATVIDEVNSDRFEVNLRKIKGMLGGLHPLDPPESVIHNYLYFLLQVLTCSYSDSFSQNIIFMGFGLVTPPYKNLPLNNILYDQF